MSRDLRLIVPPAWFDLDLDPATRRASIDRMLAERAAGAAEMPFVADLAVLLERQAAEAHERGAVRAAMFSEELGGERVSAALVVVVVEGRGDTCATAGSDAGGRVALAWGLAEVLGGEGTTELCSLGAGPAVRVRRRATNELPGGGQVPVESVQYFVPFPDGRDLVLLSFSTPSLGLADAFAEVFDAMAGTLSWNAMDPSAADPSAARGPVRR